MYMVLEGNIHWHRFFRLMLPSPAILLLVIQHSFVGTESLMNDILHTLLELKLPMAAAVVEAWIWWILNHSYPRKRPDIFERSSWRQAFVGISISYYFADLRLQGRWESQPRFCRGPATRWKASSTRGLVDVCRMGRSMGMEGLWVVGARCTFQYHGVLVLLYRKKSLISGHNIS